MTRKKIGDKFRASVEKEQASAQDRFAKAEEVMGKRPGGLTQPPASPSFTGETAPNIQPEPISFTGETDAINVVNSIGYTISAPLDKIHDNPWNARRVYLQKVIADLAASIAINDQLETPWAIEHPDIPGEFMLIDGHYRKRALPLAGKNTMRINVRKVSSNREMYQLSFRINEEREGQSVLDNALAWKHLMDEGVAENQDDIASMTNVSKTTVAKVMSVLNLPESAIEKIADSPDSFSYSQVYELTQCAKNLDEEKILSLVDRIITEGLSRRELSNIRQSLENPRVRKQKETSRQYKFKSDGSGYTGSLKDFDSGRIQLDLKVTDRQLQEKIISEIKKVLSEE